MSNFSKKTKHKREQIILPVTGKAILRDHEEQSRIAEMAYAYWEARGRPFGSPEEDWFRAEHDVRVLLGSAKT